MSWICIGCRDWNIIRVPSGVKIHTTRWLSYFPCLSRKFCVSCGQRNILFKEMQVSHTMKYAQYHVLLLDSSSESSARTSSYPGNICELKVAWKHRLNMYRALFAGGGGGVPGTASSSALFSASCALPFSLTQSSWMLNLGKSLLTFSIISWEWCSWKPVWLLDGPGT